MSYARFGAYDSDVYVFTAVDQGLQCCGCWLQEREWVDAPGSPFGGYYKAIGKIIKTSGFDTDGMLAHLAEHRAAGHMVLDSTLEDLKEDREENDAYLAEVSGGDAA